MTSLTKTQHSCRLATVLVVDDRESDLEFARITLVTASDLECRLMMARSGDEALAVMRREQQQGGDIDLMLLDINMPHMNGFEVLEDMRNDPRLAHIPVIMCTGSKYGPDRQRAMQLGALDYLEKPPFFDQLRPVLERIEGLELYSMEDGGCRLVRIF